jgi:hypothetical protein
MMKKIYYLSSLLFIFALFTGFDSINEKVWKLEKNKNGIKVYSNVPEGETLKHIKAHAIVKSSLSSIVAVLIDVPNYTNWIYNCSESNSLKQVNNQEMIYYSVSDVPWPLDNRDLVLKNTISQNNKTKTVYSISAPVLNVIPKKKGMVRIENMYGKWTITPKENGLVVLEYYLKLDVGGNVPDWIVNLFIEKGPYQSMLLFIEHIKLKKYKNTKLNFIEEP